MESIIAMKEMVTLVDRGGARGISWCHMTPMDLDNLH
jgi:hypothetical protein